MKMKLPTFLKWAGGKRRLLSQLEKHFPTEFNNYYEPFLGGASIFFHIKTKYPDTKCMLSDINEDLINTYIAVRDKPELLIRYLKWFKKNNSKELYYDLRIKFNENKIRKVKRCAAFIYINKTCFNGIYRVNSKNEFNVPYGKYKNPEIFNEENIMFASRLLQGVNIKVQDYRDILKSVKKDDFVYLDPCYDPLKKTSFTAYTPDKFCLDDRSNLNKFMLKLHKKEAYFVLSNNDIKEVVALYRQSNFKINRVNVSRCINSNPMDRGKISELVITNPKASVI